MPDGLEGDATFGHRDAVVGAGAPEREPEHALDGPAGDVAADRDPDVAGAVRVAGDSARELAVERARHGRADVNRARRRRRRGSAQDRRRRAGPCRPARLSRAGSVPPEHQRGDSDGRDACGDAEARARIRPNESDDDCGGDRGRAAEREDREPVQARVAAGAEAVDERERPGRVGEPVHGAPQPQADARAEQARDGEREQEIEGERAEPEPDRPVRRRRTGRRRRRAGSARTRRRRSSRRARRRTRSRTASGCGAGRRRGTAASARCASASCRARRARAPWSAGSARRRRCRA